MISHQEMEKILSSLEECESHKEEKYTVDFKSVFAVCTYSGTEKTGYDAIVHCLVETFEEAVDIIENNGEAIEERWSTMAFVERHQIGPGFGSGLEHYWWRWCEGRVPANSDNRYRYGYGSFVPVKTPEIMKCICGIAF